MRHYNAGHPLRIRYTLGDKYAALRDSMNVPPYLLYLNFILMSKIGRASGKPALDRIGVQDANQDMGPEVRWHSPLKAIQQEITTEAAHPF
ncbi:hypothetical protein SAMN04488523_1115 [Sulfitobacter brevis]|uniref:Uncharacterized protein n=1 Tax=Sulfitobacter brevis TaxID=74348 RepID=A0A1I2DUI6_9RHOB|nr:hypothetical protein SAMN04488523_1115 [Sulfitobacter brevis]